MGTVLTLENQKPKKNANGKKIEKTKYPGIYKVTSLITGKVSYRAFASNNGKQLSKTHEKLNEAIAWKEANDSHARKKGEFLSNRIFEKTTVSQLADVYRNGGELNGRKITGGVNIKGNPLGNSEKVYINKFISWLKLNGDPDLASFDESGASDYVDMRLRDTWQGKGWGTVHKVQPSSVRREINAIQPMWKMARRKWGFKGLENPFEDTAIAGSDIQSTRRLKPGELEKIITATENSYGMHRYYIPLALDLALETGMRREEIFELTWEDVDLVNRRINIRKSKTSVPRLIVMTVNAQIKLLVLERMLTKETLRNTVVRPVRWDEIYEFKETDRIMYPFARSTKKHSAVANAMNTFENELAKARKRAGLYDPDPKTKKDRWTFKILRREADARFLQCLHPHETARMMGHAEVSKKSMTMRYWTLDDENIRTIQDKLDRYTPNGKTFAQAAGRSRPHEYLEYVRDIDAKQQQKPRQSPIMSETPEEERRYKAVFEEFGRRRIKYIMKMRAERKGAALKGSKELCSVERK